MVNNAYLIAEYSSNVVASVNIGIGSQSICDPFVWGVIVITSSMENAFRLMNIDDSEGWLNPPTEYSFGHKDTPYRIARCVYTDIVDHEQIIESDNLNAHWLCNLLQNDVTIDATFRYDRYENPIWSSYVAPCYRQQPMSWIDLQGIEEQNAKQNWVDRNKWDEEIPF